MVIRASGLSGKGCSWGREKEAWRENSRRTKNNVSGKTIEAGSDPCFSKK